MTTVGVPTPGPSATAGGAVATRPAQEVATAAAVARNREVRPIREPPELTSATPNGGDWGNLGTGSPEGEDRAACSREGIGAIIGFVKVDVGPVSRVSANAWLD